MCVGAAAAGRRTAVGEIVLEVDDVKSSFEKVKASGYKGILICELRPGKSHPLSLMTCCTASAHFRAELDRGLSVFDRWPLQIWATYSDLCFWHAACCDFSNLLEASSEAPN